MFTLPILPDARTVRERYASSCPCTHCVRFVWYTQTTSGGGRSGHKWYASCSRSSVNMRVDASSTPATRSPFMIKSSINVNCSKSSTFKVFQFGYKSSQLFLLANCSVQPCLAVDLEAVDNCFAFSALSRSLINCSSSSGIASDDILLIVN